MGIIGCALKICGTIVEGCGKTLCDIAEVAEKEKRDYKASEQYIKDKEQREEYIKEIKANLARIKDNSKELVKTYKK